MSHANVSIFVPHVGCPHQCSFCDQRSISSAAFVPDGAFVRTQCQNALETFSGDPAKAQIAFFGGSFTAIPETMMTELLEAACEYVGEHGFDSIRVSTRPDAITPEILNVLKKYHVRSVELGAQSMNDRVLALNLRGHTAQDVEKASRMIRDFGFELGLQMMVGLYGENAKDALLTAEKLAALHPDTVRIYPTVVLKNTRLAEWYAEGKYLPPATEEIVDVCAELLDFFEENNIPVIRLGLHDSPTLRGARVAGVYHPALRELCEARRTRKKVLSALTTCPRGDYTIVVSDRYLSQYIGQKKENCEFLKSRGYSVTFVPDPTVKNRDFVLKKGERPHESIEILGNAGF